MRNNAQSKNERKEQEEEEEEKESDMVATLLRLLINLQRGSRATVHART